jgi:hypothetical protein|tara:strand:+ start:35656 stop:36393 length:738 start_codon:yes stop_codon:yes gene_type:complete
MSRFKESFTYFFDDEKWLAKGWLLFLIPLVPVFGVLGIFLLKGWRLSMVDNLSKGEKTLPKFDPLTWLKNGLILWVALFVYSFVPHIVASITGVGGIVDFFSDIRTLITEGFEPFINDELQDFFWQMVIFLVWGIISLPIFQAGMIRFTINGSWKSLYNIPGNAAVAARHTLAFIKFYGYWLLFILLVILADMILAATFIGALLIPVVTVTFFYIMTASELGHLAKRVRASRSQSLNITESANSH